MPHASAQTMHVSYACAGEARVARVTFAVKFGVCSIQAAMAPLCHHPRPPSPSPKNSVVHTSTWVEHIWMCHIWSIPMVR